MRTIRRNKLLANALLGPLTLPPGVLLTHSRKYAANGPDSDIRFGFTFRFPKWTSSRCD
jgi:hypothetical protein